MGVSEPSYASQRCLVLGGRGFMGSHLVDALLAAGAQVRSFDRPQVAAPEGSAAAEPALPGLEQVEGDFTSQSDVDAAMAGMTQVFHLVSTTLPKSSNADPVYDAQTNLLGSLGAIEAARRHAVRRLVFISSGGTVYGTPQRERLDEDHPTEPLCAYGITKLAIEKHLQLARYLHGLESVVLRVANPYGERQRPHSSQGAVAVFLGRALAGEPIEIWGDGSVVRDFIHVQDVVQAMLLAGQVPAAPHQVFNIGSGGGHSLNQIIAALGAALGRTLEVRYGPGRAFDVRSNVLDTGRAHRHLGWQPTISLEAGLRRYVEWLRQAA
jgi:UDP-glucose 4-epimerase